MVTGGGRYFTFCIKLNHNSTAEQYQNKEIHVSFPVDGCLSKAHWDQQMDVTFFKKNPQCINILNTFWWHKSNSSFITQNCQWFTHTMSCVLKFRWVYLLEHIIKYVTCISCLLRKTNFHEFSKLLYWIARQRQAFSNLCRNIQYVKSIICTNVLHYKFSGHCSSSSHCLKIQEFLLEIELLKIKFRNNILSVLLYLSTAKSCCILSPVKAVDYNQLLTQRFL